MLLVAKGIVKYQCRLRGLEGVAGFIIIWPSLHLKPNDPSTSLEHDFHSVIQEEFL